MPQREGYLLIDHRESPGVEDRIVVPAGLPPGSGHGLFEAGTLSCLHCGCVQIKNPDRVRPRPHCRKCDGYFCDACAAAATQPGYVHRSFKELSDLVRSGRFALAGSASAPVLIPTRG